MLNLPILFHDDEVNNVGIRWEIEGSAYSVDYKLHIVVQNTEYSKGPKTATVGTGRLYCTFSSCEKDSILYTPNLAEGPDRNEQEPLKMFQDF